MKAILVNGLVRPLVARIGTALAAYLLAVGADGETVNLILNGLSAAVLVGIDLIVARHQSREAD